MLKLKKSSGFTMIELVVIIVLLGILAAFALPRFFDLNSFQTRATYDEVAGAVRYAQKLAVATGCDVRFSISANSYALQRPSPNCGSGSFVNLTGHPISGRTVTVSLAATTSPFTFDAMGRSDNPVTITVGGTDSFSIVAETGYVDAP